MLNSEKRDLHDVTFLEDEVILARTALDKLRTTVEFFYYLMDHRGLTSFTMVLLSADDLKLNKMLKKVKRHTDILFEIDKKNNVYMILCQSTDRDGGKEFAEILLSNIKINGGHNIYCIVSELKTTKYTIQEVIFKMVEKYIITKEDERDNYVFFNRFEEIKKDT